MSFVVHKMTAFYGHCRLLLVIAGYDRQSCRARLDRASPTPLPQAEGGYAYADLRGGEDGA